MKLLCLFFVSILFCGCASTITPALYIPEQTNETKLIYRNGNPFAFGKNDSISFFISIEPEIIVRKQYMKALVLLRNNSQNEILIEPEKIASIKVPEANNALLPPIQPYTILQDIDDKKASDLILQTIGGVINSVAAQPTTVQSSTGVTYTIDDAGQKRKNIAKETMAANNATEMMYEMYKSSVNSGILKIHTLFPGESINGYIYFLMPVSFNPLLTYPHNLTYLVSVKMAGGRPILFTPHVIRGKR